MKVFEYSNKTKQPRCSHRKLRGINGEVYGHIGCYRSDLGMVEYTHDYDEYGSGFLSLTTVVAGVEYTRNFSNYKYKEKGAAILCGKFLREKFAQHY